MTVWATDCHVHFYAGYRLGAAVNSSWRNSRAFGEPRPVGQCWCLASPPGVAGLEVLAAMAAREGCEVRLTPLVDGQGKKTTLLETEDGPVMVVPGTQAISAEGLEVLSLGAELAATASPLPLAAVVDSIHEIGGLPVVPWGVGKWLGRRGRLVSGLIGNTDGHRPLLFADNANRPWWWPYPALLEKATKAGFPVVAGSDPLPVAGDERRIGSAGVLCPVASIERAWQQIRESLLEVDNSSSHAYGKPMSNHLFWRNQVLLRVPSGSS